jgi:hypothetical protein
MTRTLHRSLTHSAVDWAGRRGVWSQGSTSSFRRVVLAIVVLFVLSLPAVTPRIYASDEIEYFAYLRSIWFDRDLSFDNEYRYFYDRGIAHGVRPRVDRPGFYGDSFEATFLEATTSTGRRINFAPIGTAILWAPFYAVADAGVRLARAFGSTVAADGLSQPYIAAVAYASAVYGFLAVLLSACAVRRIFGDADLSAVAVWLGTPLLFYMYVAPGYSHGCSAFAVAAFVVAWLRVRESWSAAGVVALGALAALMGMVREQDGLIAIGPGVDFVAAAVRSIRTSRGTIRQWAARAAAGVATTALCTVPQGLTYLTLNGRLGPSPVVARKMYWTAPYVWKVLASTQRGAIFWTPLLIPAFIGLGALLLVPFDVRDSLPVDRQRERRWIGAIFVIMVASQLWASGSVASWAGGVFGQRRFIGLTICLVVGLSAAFRLVPTGWRRYTFAFVILACIWWNIGLITQYGSGLATRDGLDLRVNAYHNVVTVPGRIPALAYRYLFDRRSFYQGTSAAAR